MVIITHYDWGDKDSPFFTMLINMAVPVFMIISGYNFAKMCIRDRRKAAGRSKYPLIRRCLNGETRMSNPHAVSYTHLLRIALQAATPEQSIEVILEYLGNSLNGERTYIFAVSYTHLDVYKRQWQS